MVQRLYVKNIDIPGECHLPVFGLTAEWNIDNTALIYPSYETDETAYDGKGNHEYQHILQLARYIRSNVRSNSLKCGLKFENLEKTILEVNRRLLDDKLVVIVQRGLSEEQLHMLTLDIAVEE